MFRRAIQPTEPGVEADMAIIACRKRMNFARWMIFSLTMILIAALIVMRIVPDMLGITGKRLLGAVVAVMIVQGLDWIVGYQRLQKLSRISRL